MAPLRVDVARSVPTYKIRKRSAQILSTGPPSRAQIQAKGKHHTPERIEDALPIKFVAQDIFWQREEYKRQIERATIIYQQEFAHQYAQPGTWLFQRAIYALGLQKERK